MPLPYSRQRPWPYSARLNTIGIMVRGNLVAKKLLTFQNAVPTDQQYGADDLYRERSFAFSRAVLGMGERSQSAQTSKRYRFAINAWHVGGLRGRGPFFDPITPTSTGEIRDFPEALHGGVLTQFILAGRFALRRTGDADADQVVSKDFGVGRQTQYAVRFMAAGGVPVDGLYVALDNQELWQYNGATWAQAETTATVQATAVAVVGDEFWRGWDNKVAKATADPMVAANYAAPITIGDASSLITCLQVVDNQLFIFKDNGRVYTVDASGNDVDLTPGLDTTREATNGRSAAAWLNAIWYRNGSSFFRIQSGDPAVISQVGPERMMENDSEVQGRTTCFAGYGAWYGFMGLQNMVNGASYLLQYGSWFPPETAEDASYDFGEVLNGAVIKWSGKAITALRVSFVVTGNPRCYVGFSDGSFGFFILPRAGNPFSDPACTFTTELSYTRWPLHTLLAAADWKEYMSVAAFGQTLNADERVEVAYSTDGGVTFPILGSDLVVPGARVDFPANTNGKAIEIEERYLAPTGATTPVIDTLVLRERIHPAMRLEFAFAVDARHFPPRRDGQRDILTSDAIRALVQDAHQNPQTVILELPDETVGGFSAINYEEQLPDHPNRWGTEWLIPVSFLQYSTLEVFGTIERLVGTTIGDLVGTTIGELSTL